MLCYCCKIIAVKLIYSLGGTINHTNVQANGYKSKEIAEYRIVKIC